MSPFLPTVPALTLREGASPDRAIARFIQQQIFGQSESAIVGERTVELSSFDVEVNRCRGPRSANTCSRPQPDPNLAQTSPLPATEPGTDSGCGPTEAPNQLALADLRATKKHLRQSPYGPSRSRRNRNSPPVYADHQSRPAGPNRIGRRRNHRRSQSKRTRTPTRFTRSFCGLNCQLRGRLKHGRFGRKPKEAPFRCA
jgi:hypothetical protein